MTDQSIIEELLESWPKNINHDVKNELDYLVEPRVTEEQFMKKACELANTLQSKTTFESKHTETGVWLCFPQTPIGSLNAQF